MFELGNVVATPAAIEFMNANFIWANDLLNRHATGDWGDLCNEDRELNELSLKTEGRLFSSYNVGTDPTIQKIWIITEWDRSYTTILMPDDY